MENTKAWANFQEKKPEKQEVDDHIETGAMNKEEKSQLLHEVAKSALDEEQESKHPKPVEKTDEEIDEERRQTANELSENAIEVGNMSFSANDLNAFSALSSQRADKTFGNGSGANASASKTQNGVKPPRKDFYEELYDKSKK